MGSLIWRTNLSINISTQNKFQTDNHIKIQILSQDASRIMSLRDRLE